jgi:hypothetical protein
MTSPVGIVPSRWRHLKKRNITMSEPANARMHDMMSRKAHGDSETLAGQSVSEHDGELPHSKLLGESLSRQAAGSSPGAVSQSVSSIPGASASATGLIAGPG